MENHLTWWSSKNTMREDPGHWLEDIDSRSWKDRCRSRSTDERMDIYKAEVHTAELEESIFHVTAWSHGGNGTIFKTESRNRTIFLWRQGKRQQWISKSVDGKQTIWSLVGKVCPRPMTKGSIRKRKFSQPSNLQIIVLWYKSNRE